MHWKTSRLRDAAIVIELCALSVPASGCFQPRESADFGTYTEGVPFDAVDGAAGPANAGDPWGTDDAGQQTQPTTPGTPDTGSSGQQDTPGNPAGGTGGTADDGIEDGTSGSSNGGSRPTSMTFSVLTQPNGGRYQPRNIGAIWIEDASGKYIKTLRVWAGIREGDLRTYNSAAGIGFFSSPPADVVSSATLSKHQTHTVSWNLTDTSGAQVPDGDYTIRINTADDREATTSVPFAKGATPSASSPPNAASFTNMSINYQ